jgi:YHS domain-containing protein
MPKKKENVFEKDKESEFLDEPEEFLEPEEHTESHGEAEFKIHVGGKEADVYTEEGREELEEDEGEIAPWEEGFSEGAQGIEGGHCAHCHKQLGDREEGVIEREFKGKVVFFCSEKCARGGPVGRKD